MAWPSYALIEADGYALGRDPDVERTQLDDGFVAQELRYTGAMRLRRFRGRLESDADLVRFEAWAGREAHTWFDWTDTEDGTVRQVRVRGGAGGIRYTAEVRRLRRQWIIELELEGQNI